MYTFTLIYIHKPQCIIIIYCSSSSSKFYGKTTGCEVDVLILLFIPTSHSLPLAVRVILCFTIKTHTPQYCSQGRAICLRPPPSSSSYYFIIIIICGTKRILLDYYKICSKKYYNTMCININRIYVYIHLYIYSYVL